MEVIKHGNYYKEIKCEKCNAILAYCKNDIKKIDSCEEIFGELHSSYQEYIVCPECNKKINLSWIIDGEEQVKEKNYEK